MTMHAEKAGAGWVSESTPAVRDYHPLAQKVGPDGVRDFFMPASEAATDRVLKTVLRQGAYYLNGVGIDNSRTAEVLWLMLIYIGLDAASTYILTQIASANAARGVTASYNGDDSALSRIALGLPFESAAAARLSSRTFTSSLARTWGRYARSLWRGDAVSRKPPQLIDRMRDVLCFAADPWHCRLAVESGRHLVLSHPENWLDGYARGLSSVEPLDNNLIAGVFDICTAALRDEGVAMPAPVQASLRDSIQTLARVAAAMRASVERKRRHLPRAFWATSMGPVQNRVVARLVQKEGGSVTAFDHGTGCGWMDLPELAAMEWDFCDTFVAFNETNAAAIRQLIACGDYYRANARACTVTASPMPLYDTSLADRRSGLRSGGRLSVWYIPTHYTLEQTYLPPMPPDVVEVDFQARLLRELDAMGHEVVVKPHPGCKVGIPLALAKVSDARIETRPFEAVAAEPDVVVLDYPQSTTFRSAVIAGIPMVVLDPERVPFLPEARALLAECAAIVPIVRDSGNRRRVDGGRLADAVAQAPGRYSRTFQRAYYPVS